jgi:hypothetical protein
MPDAHPPEGRPQEPLAQLSLKEELEELLIDALNVDNSFFELVELQFGQVTSAGFANDL